MISLSSPVRALLDLLQFRCGVSIDVVDTALRAVPPAPAADFAGAIEESGVKEPSLAAIRSGESRIERGLAVPLALYPVRRQAQVVGLLIIARRGPRPSVTLDEDEDRHLEAVSEIARGVVEDGLAVGAQLTRTADRTRRLQGILRFISQLASRGGERDMLQAVVQAATIWFDLDCRIYYRDAGGDFILFAALPGIDRSELHARLDGALLGDLAAVRRLFSFSDLEEGEEPARRGDVLVIPIGERPDWVMLLNGVFEPEVELAFSTIAHVIDGELHRAAYRRMEHWQQRLLAHSAEVNLVPERLLVLMLDELAASVGAAGARVSVERSGAHRTVSTVDANGESASRLLHSDAEVGRHVRHIRIGFQAQARLELWGRREPFDFPSLAQVDAWSAALRPWLSGTTLGAARDDAIDNRIDELAFERRLQDEVERAKRFNLELSLVLIDGQEVPSEERPGTTLADAVRPELRASDLLGRVRGGVLAVLLVHAGSEGAQSVTNRVRQRMARVVNHTQRAAVRLGQAVFSSECPSGEALIGQALQGLTKLNAGE